MKKTKLKVGLAALLVAGVGVVGGSAAGSAMEASGDRPPPPPDVPVDRYTVTDENGPVGHVEREELMALPTLVDGELQQAFHPAVGWDVHNDEGLKVGYLVPNYGFMTPEDADAFAVDPGQFEPIVGPLDPSSAPPGVPDGES